VVGVNVFQEGPEPPPPLHRVDPAVAQRQGERLARVRAERDGAQVRRALARLAEAARGTDNLLPPLLEAVEAYATLGEMVGVLKSVFGQYRPPVVV